MRILEVNGREYSLNVSPWIMAYLDQYRATLQQAAEAISKNPDAAELWEKKIRDATVKLLRKAVKPEVDEDDIDQATAELLAYSNEVWGRAAEKAQFFRSQQPPSPRG